MRFASSQSCPETRLFPPDHGGFSCSPFVELKIVTYRHPKPSAGSLLCHRPAPGKLPQLTFGCRVPCDPLHPHWPVLGWLHIWCLAWLHFLELHVTSTQGLKGSAPTVPMLAPQLSLHLHLLCLTPQLPIPPPLHPPTGATACNRVPQDTVKSITSTSECVWRQRKRKIDRQTDRPTGALGWASKQMERTNLKS